jgi:CRP-like cAMP-binding protein
LFQAYGGGNRLLDCLPEPDKANLVGAIHVVSFACRDPITTIGESVEHVAFPIDCIFSIVALFESGDTTEVGTVGREGFVPAEIVAGAETALRSTFCQVPGRAAVMHRAVFERSFAGRGAFATLVQRNTSARLFTSEQLSACNLTHSVMQRCARWLLMTRERVNRNDFPLTHEFLAMMLGVRRAGVTEAAGALQRMGAIRYRRGNITVVDEALLLQISCECYAATNAINQAALAGLGGAADAGGTSNHEYGRAIGRESTGA